MLSFLLEGLFASRKLGKSTWLGGVDVDNKTFSGYVVEIYCHVGIARRVVSKTQLEDLHTSSAFD
jgi:hypothetical protein